MKTDYTNPRGIKVGDLVRIVAEHGACDGIAVRLDPCGWWEILTEDGKKILWPEPKLVVLKENAC